MAHDFRRIYGYGLQDVSVSIPWHEALMHFQMIKSGAVPESWLYVAMSDGASKRPWKFEEAVLFDLFDLTHAVNSKKKTKPITRPWATGKKKIGKGKISLKAGIDLFASLGHKPTMK